MTQERPVKPVRVYVRDKRTGALREEIQQRPVQAVRFATIMRDREIERERKLGLSNICPLCGQPRALNGECDFCENGEYTPKLMPASEPKRFTEITLASAHKVKQRAYASGIRPAMTTTKFN